MLNTLALVGRACADPKVREVTINNEKKKIAEVNMAVDRPTKNKETDFFTVEFWNNQAETAEKYLKKGHLFGVEGRLRQETWTHNNEKHSKVIVSGTALRLLPNEKQETQQQQQQQPQQQQLTHEQIFGSNTGSTGW